MIAIDNEGTVTRMGKGEGVRSTLKYDALALLADRTVREHAEALISLIRGRHLKGFFGMDPDVQYGVSKTEFKRLMSKVFRESCLLEGEERRAFLSLAEEVAQAAGEKASIMNIMKDQSASDIFVLAHDAKAVALLSYTLQEEMLEARELGLSNPSKALLNYSIGEIKDAIRHLPCGRHGTASKADFRTLDRAINAGSMRIDSRAMPISLRKGEE